jgi:hypothetical protein
MVWQIEDRINQLVRLISDEKQPDKIKVMAEELYELLSIKQQSMTSSERSGKETVAREN